MGVESYITIIQVNYVRFCLLFSVFSILKMCCHITYKIMNVVILIIFIEKYQLKCEINEENGGK